MPGGYDTEPDSDPQDQSEAFDEASFDEADAPRRVSEEMRTFEELSDVEDLTQAVGDRDDDEAVALDADEFDPDAVGDADLEEDHELEHRASDEEHEDDLDGLGPEDGGSPGRIARSEIDGLDEVRDASEAEGGEDDFTDFEARSLADDDLADLGYDGSKR